MPYPAVPEVDLHVHTVASGHAYSTIGEIARAAGERRLLGVGMTDHGPALPGGPHLYHFSALRFIPPVLHGVRVFKGIEANILGPGRIDLPERYLDRLELILAGFHDDCGYLTGSARENTRVLCDVMAVPQIRVITHPGNPAFPIDLETVVREAAATGTALELNNSSFTLSRPGSDGTCRRIAALCARHGTRVAVGSDAHIAQGVGEFEAALQALEEAGVAWEQIVNRTLDATLDFLDLDD